MAFPILGSGSLAVAYNIENSLRFNDDDSPWGNRNFSSSGSRRKFTISCWIKRGELAVYNPIWAAGPSGGGQFSLVFDGNDKLILREYNTTDSEVLNLVTADLYRDPSAWYHIVASVDTTQGTAANRAKLYINGSQPTLGTATYCDQNYDLLMNSTGGTGKFLFGTESYTGGNRFDGHIAEFIFVNDAQLAATSFGETDGDSGIWKPIEPDLTYGTNGLFLEFKQSGTGADSSGMGADTSGNDNHLTISGLTATDQTTDTPTNNFCTWNPLFKHSGNPAYTPSSFSEGNLKLTLQNDSATMGTIGVSKGKWYYEYKFAENVSANANYPTTGYTTNSHTFSAGNMVGRATASDSNYDGSTVYRGQKGSTVINAQVFLGIEEADDIIGWYLDLDNETIICHKNGSTAMGSGYTSGIDWSSGLTTVNTQDGFFYPMTRNNGHETVGDEVNFGNPSFAISSGNADANDYGNFEYNPTIGGVNYYAICSKNLAEFG